MSICTAPVTGQHKDDMTMAKCPKCSARAAATPMTVAAQPPSLAKSRWPSAARITEVLGCRKALGRDLSDAETERLLEIMSDNYAVTDTVLQKLAMQKAEVFEADGKRDVEASFAFELREQIPTLPEWMQDNDRLWDAIDAASAHKATEEYLYLILDDGEPESFDGSGGFERAIALSTYETAREAIVDKVGISRKNVDALRQLDDVGPDAILDPTHVELALRTYPNL